MLDTTDTLHLETANRPQSGRMPAFTWSELEEALVSIAASTRQRDMAADLVSATRKQAPFMPPSLVLREILCMAWVIADETFLEGPDVT